MFEQIQPMTGMRKAEYDKRQVYCANASLIGGGAYKARINDFILYRTEFTDGSDRLTLGRVIGRVRYAPALNSDNPDNTAKNVTNFILSLTLSDFGDSAMIRWVDPKTVLRISRPDKSRELFAEFFFSEKLPFNMNELCRLSYYGALSSHYYTLEHAQAVIKKQNDQLQNAGISIPKDSDKLL